MICLTPCLQSNGSKGREGGRWRPATHLNLAPRDRRVIVLLTGELMHNNNRSLSSKCAKTGCIMHTIVHFIYAVKRTQGGVYAT